MALYKHVTNKEELLDGMVDVIMGEIDPPASEAQTGGAVRQKRILSPSGKHFCATAGHPR